MKKLLTIALSLIVGYSYSQCSLSGLDPTYCTSDSGSQLTATCPGGNPTIIGSGVNSSGFFSPGVAGEGTIEIYVFDGSTTYTIDQSGTFDPDTTGGGTSVSLSDDDVSGQLPIGFTFRFFDNLYTTFQISSNGFITFGTNTDNGCCSGPFIPNTSAFNPHNLIAFAWEDLDPAGVGSINYQTVGTAPNRKLIMNFDDIPHWPGPGPNANVTAQVQLWEGCGRIEIHTTDKPSNGTTTMGIENASGTVAYAPSGRNSSFWSTTNDYVAFIPNCGDTFTTVVSGGPDLVADLDSNACFGDSNGAISLTATGSAPFTYNWSTGGTSSSISGLIGGTYSVTVTDDNGCARKEEYEVYSPPSISIDLMSDPAFCESDETGAVYSSVTGGTPPYSYSWTSGGTMALDSNLVAGTYTLSITDGNNCTNESFVVVGFLNEDPDVDLGEDKSICPDNIALLATQPGYSAYAWSTGDTTSSTVVNAAGTYSVTVTSNAGCEGSDEVVVVAAVPVEVDLGENLSGLAQITIDATNPAFTQYLWNTGSTNSSINVATSGNYTVTVSDTNGCTSNDQIRVDIWPNSITEIGEGDIMVYPNPAKTHVNVISGSTHQNVALSLVDVSGRVVMNKVITMNAGEQLPLNVSGLSSGNYTLTLKSDELLEQHKVVIQ